LSLAALRRPALLLPLLVIPIAAALLYRYWQGPLLPGYRLELHPLVQEVVATGRVISTSRSQIGSEITGVALERRVQEGDRVQAGDVLVTLRSDDLSARVREAEAALTSLRRSTRPQAEAALRQAEAQLQQATRERQRRRELLAQSLIARESAEQAEQAEAVARAAAERARAQAAALASGSSDEAQLRERLTAAQAQLAKTVLRADRAGTVLTRSVEPGDLVQPGRVLLEIALDGDTEILLPVDEKNLSLLRVGQTAQCVADSWPERPFRAELRFIAPAIDPERGTVDLRLRVNPVPEYLRQDMTVSVNIRTGRRDSALVVPNDALLGVDGGRATVLVLRGARLVRQAVHLGLRGVALTEIVEGLSAGEQVLADAGSATVAQGSRVRLSLQALPAAASDPGTRGETPVRFD